MISHCTFLSVAVLMGWSEAIKAILEMASLFLLFLVSFINHFPADAAEPLSFRPHEVGEAACKVHPRPLCRPSWGPQLGAAGAAGATPSSAPRTAGPRASSCCTSPTAATCATTPSSTGSSSSAWRGRARPRPRSPPSGAASEAGRGGSCVTAPRASSVAFSSNQRGWAGMSNWRYPSLNQDPTAL